MNRLLPLLHFSKPFVILVPQCSSTSYLVLLSFVNRASLLSLLWTKHASGVQACITGIFGMFINNRSVDATLPQGIISHVVSTSELSLIWLLDSKLTVHKSLNFQKIKKK